MHYKYLVAAAGLFQKRLAGGVRHESWGKECKMQLGSCGQAGLFESNNHQSRTRDRGGMHKIG